MGARGPKPGTIRNKIPKGRRFGRLKVVGEPELWQRGDGRNRAYYPVRCDCGSTLVVPAHNLRNGNTTSCGCYHRERASEANTTHGASRGYTKTRLYRIWRAMRYRCNSPTASNYQWYGGLGISVCAEWDVFEGFRDWALANGYADDLTIDRLDPAKNYEPSNCEWVTFTENVKRSKRTSPGAQWTTCTDCGKRWRSLKVMHCTACHSNVTGSWDRHEAKCIG